MVEFLNQKLRDDVEGTCTGKHGYIIKVIGMVDVGQGRVIPVPVLPSSTQPTKLSCLKPFKGEVMDAKITNVNKMGFFAEVGPLNISCQVT